MINSTTSGTAPTDFKLYDSTESSNDIINKNNDTCNLCSSDRTPSYCIRCLNNGEFTYSKESQYNITRHYMNHQTTFISAFDKYETYSMKKQRYLNIKQKVKEFSDRISCELERNNNEKKRNLIYRKKKDIEILQNIISNIRISINQCREQYADDLEINENTRGKSCNRVVKTSRIVDYTTASARQYLVKRDRLQRVERTLAEHRKRRVSEIYERVFTLTRLHGDTTQTDSMIGELAEAVQVTYINDQWVNSIPRTSSFSVCGALIPFDGDYNSFQTYFCDNFEEEKLTSVSRASDVEGAKVNEEKINVEVGAALGHLAQSCCLTASVLDIVLFGICDFREFTSRYLQAKRFEVLVDSLNCLVQYICATQCITITDSRLCCTNLLSLINSENLGRKHAFQYYARSAITCVPKVCAEKENLPDVDNDWENVQEDFSANDTVNARPTIALLSNIWNAAINYN